jgi:hypothetical protein
MLIASRIIRVTRVIRDTEVYLFLTTMTSFT